MTRGRKKKPTHLKVMDGSAAKNPQRLNPDEPTVQTGKPKDYPESLESQYAKATWDSLWSQAEMLGVHSPAFAEAAEVYANLKNDWRNAKNGLERLKYVNSMRAILSEFGLTPASKAKVSTLKKQESESKLAGLLKRANG